MRRIICKWHKEDTPSMVIYPEAAYCFGCGKKAKLEEVGIEPDPDFKIEEEDISKTIEYINTLPIREIRGLGLPYDDLFYYIVWPLENYYIKRFILKDAPFKQKYICPKGHERPLLVLNRGQNNLMIVEGELNALSIIEALIPNYYNIYVDTPDLTVVSPGGASNIPKHLTEYLKYDNIKIVADLDKAGVAAGLQLENALVKHGKKVEHYFFEEDANDLLVKYGVEEIRKRYNLEV